MLRRSWQLVAVATALSACSLVAVESPLSVFEPAGPFARQLDDLFWPVFWTATAIFVVVMGGILAAAFRYRDRPDRKEPRQVHGNTALEITWTVIPALILAAVAVPTIRAVFDLTECGAESMDVEVIGHQWWFEYRYPDSGVTTANVLVIPAGREVCLRMTSADVLHNYWVPALNGKRYLVPGQETLLRMQADQPGEFWGHCGEFCGLSHSLMRARVVAMDEAGFEQWVNAQLVPAEVPAEGDPEAAGWRVYQERCITCHHVATADQVFGPEPGAFVGPNLTHFADRSVFAGAVLPGPGQTRAEALTEWLADPPKVKPGSFMPDLALTGEEIESLIVWLESLE